VFRKFGKKLLKMDLSKNAHERKFNEMLNHQSLHPLLTVKKLRLFLISAGSFLTILSQAPFLREQAGIITQLISYPIWLIVIMISLFLKVRYKNPSIQIIVILFFLFVIIGSFFQIITRNQYLTSGFSFQIYLSLLMVFIGYANSDILVNDGFFKVKAAYIVATIILCINIFLTYFQSYNWTTVEYLYRAKNSTGQIILTASVLLLFFLPYKKIKRIGVYILLIFFFIMIVMLRSRATLVSYFFVPVVFLSQQKIKVQYKIFIISALSALAILLFSNDLFFNFFIKNIIFKMGDNMSILDLDLNYITSNRADYFNLFQELIHGSEFTGIGYYYLDNFFLAAIINYGFILGIIVLVIALFPLKHSFKKSKNLNHNLRFCYISLALIYTFNGLFEGYAPFGPGAKCFLLWLIFGVALNQSNNLHGLMD